MISYFKRYYVYLLVFKYLFLFMYLFITCTHIGAYMPGCECGGQQRVRDPLELELSAYGC